MTNKDVLITAISDAFKATPLPHQLVDTAFELHRPFELSYLRRIFNSYSWKDISQQHLVQSGSMLIYMTEEAYVYYLPAYLILVLDYDTSDFAGRCTLNMFSENSSSPQQEAIISLLNEQQKRVVLQVFQYVQEHYFEEGVPKPSNLLHPV